MRLGTKLFSPKGPIITEVVDTKNILVIKPADTSIPPSTKASTTPPYSQRLEPSTPSKPNPIATDLLDQLKQMIVQIPLLDALKEIPLYNKVLKEVCIKKIKRKKKDPPTINVLGKHYDLMLSKTLMPKYSNP